MSARILQNAPTSSCSAVWGSVVLCTGQTLEIALHDKEYAVSLAAHTHDRSCDSSPGGPAECSQVQESVDMALVHGQAEHKFNWVSGHWGERSRTRAGKPLVIQSYAARAGKGVFGRVWSKKPHGVRSGGCRKWRARRKVCIRDILRKCE